MTAKKGPKKRTAKAPPKKRAKAVPPSPAKKATRKKTAKNVSKKRSTKKSPPKGPRRGRPRKEEQVGLADEMGRDELADRTPLERIRPRERTVVFAFTSGDSAGDQRAAMRAAGYADSYAPEKVFGRPRVRAAIAYVQAQETESHILSREALLGELSMMITGRHGHAPPAEAAEVGPASPGPLRWRDRVSAANLFARIQGWTIQRHVHSAEGPQAEALAGMASEIAGVLASVRRAREAEADDTVLGLALGDGERAPAGAETLDAEIAPEPSAKERVT